MYSDRLDTLFALLLLRAKLCGGKDEDKCNGDSVNTLDGRLGDEGINDDDDAIRSGTADGIGDSICDNVDDLSRCRSIAPERG